MADKMDDLLELIAQEANAQVNFDAAFAQILAKGRAAEQEAFPQASQKTSRKWQRRWTRGLSMAAGVVVLLGAAVMLGRSGLKGELGAGTAAPQAAAAQDAAPFAVPAAPAAPEPAAMNESVPAPVADSQDAGAGVSAAQSYAEKVEDPFYGSAPITVPASTQATKTGNGAQAAPEPRMASAPPHDAYDAEGSVCMIGEAQRHEALKKLEAMGYSVSSSSDAYVDQLASLLPGEACIGPSGEIGVWNTGNGFITLTDPALGQMDIYDALLSAL